MSQTPSFEEFIRRVRAGDQAAAAELLRTYEPAIRRAVRFRITDAGMQNWLDSMDICNSVLGSFFLRTASGQYDLDTPEQLLGLLTVMARNKLNEQIRKRNRPKHGGGKVRSLGPNEELITGSDPTPSSQVAAGELLQEAQRRLSPEERQLVELRSEGREWADIAAQLGGSPDALRKQLTRALDRVAQELGLDESGHE